MNAWYAVGVGQAYTGTLKAAYTQDDSLFCSLPANVQFENLSESAFSYLWDFGDGTTSAGYRPSHAYTQQGTYDVTLLAYDCNGNPATSFVAARITVDFNQNCPINMPGTGNAFSASCSGTLYDSGGGNDYPNGSISYMTITAPNGGPITLTFSEFDYAPGDYIQIYDGTSQQAPLLGTYSGTTLPPTISSSDSSLTVREVTNGSNSRAGFKAAWSCLVNAEATVNTDIQIWPNPTSDRVRIFQPLTAQSDVKLEVIDAFGRTLLRREEAAVSQIQATFDVSDLAEGIYFVRIQSDEGTFTKKIQKY